MGQKRTHKQYSKEFKEEAVTSRGLPDLDMKTPEFKRLKLDSHEGLLTEEAYYEELMRRGGITEQADFEAGKSAFRKAMLGFGYAKGGTTSSIFSLPGGIVKSGC
jgi:hypothetical protein